MAFFNGYGSSHRLRQLHEQDELREKESKVDSRTNGCYLFITFPTYMGSSVHEVGKFCVLAKKTHGTSGRFLGIARKVFSYGYESKGDEACVVFLFPSKGEAERFFQSDPNFKQPDFPPSAGHCQAWIVDRHYCPESDDAFNTFMISEIRLKHPEEYLAYKKDFATPFGELLSKYRAHPYTVQTTEVKGVRRFYKDPHTILTVHLFRNPINLDDVMCDEKYEELKRIHQFYAYEMTSVFTIDPRACP